MTTLAAPVGAVAAVGLAGLARDRLRGRRRPVPPNGAGAADPTLRYYRDVGDSTFGGPTPGGHGF